MRHANGDERGVGNTLAAFTIGPNLQLQQASQAGGGNCKNLPAGKSKSLPVSAQLGRQSATIFSATASGVGSVIGSSPGMTCARIRVRVGPGLNKFTRIAVDSVSAA